MLSRGERGVGVGALWKIVKEIKAATEAEWIVFWFIEGLALGLIPEGLRVLWNIWTWGGRSRVAEKRVGFHLAELSVCVPRSS